MVRSLQTTIQNQYHMKTLFTLISALLTGISLSAQITIDRSDFGTIGDKIYYAHDTTLAANFSVGAAGPDVTWDFTATVSANYYDSSLFVDPLTIQGAPEEANIAIEQGPEMYSFFNITDSTVKIIIPLDMLNGATNPQILISKFPFSYDGTTVVRDSSSTKIEGTPDDFGFSGAPFDSMRIEFNIHTKSMVDGWGSVKTPASTFDALRVKNETDLKVKVQGKLPVIGTWIDVPYDAANETQVIYGWYAKDQKYTVAEAELDTLGQVVAFNYQVASIPVSTGINELNKHVTAALQPNPVNDVLKLTFNSNYTEKGNLSIFDITGKTVANQEININKNENELSIKTLDLNNGIYFTHIVSEHMNTTTKFVVKH